MVWEDVVMWGERDSAVQQSRGKCLLCLRGHREGTVEREDVDTVDRMSDCRRTEERETIDDPRSRQSAGSGRRQMTAVDAEERDDKTSRRGRTLRCGEMLRGELCTGVNVEKRGDDSHRVQELKECYFEEDVGRIEVEVH